MKHKAQAAKAPARGMSLLGESCEGLGHPESAGRMSDGFYYVDTPFACGGLTVQGGLVAEPCAPIFRRWRGSPVGRFRRHIRWSVSL